MSSLQTNADIRTGNNGFYNPTVVDEQCDGTGNNCGAFAARSDTTGTVFWLFATSTNSVVSGHTYRSRGSWNDATSGTRYTNAVSPLTAWNA